MALDPAHRHRVRRVRLWAGLDQQQRRALRKKQHRREAVTRTRTGQPHALRGSGTPEWRRLRARIATNTRWSRPMARSRYARYRPSRRDRSEARIPAGSISARILRNSATRGYIASNARRATWLSFAR